jgi:hypothetical protein
MPRFYAALSNACRLSPVIDTLTNSDIVTSTKDLGNETNSGGRTRLYLKGENVVNPMTSEWSSIKVCERKNGTGE